MAEELFRLTKRPPKPSIYYEQYREEIRDELREIGQIHVRLRKRVVANFSAKTRPRFTYRTTTSIAKVELIILVEEASPSRPIWLWLDKTGTKPHVIRPRPNNRRGLLFFRAGTYVSKTSADPARYGGPGIVRGGQLRSVRQVNHPGFEPRKFSETFNDDLEPETKKRLRNAGRRGLRKARTARGIS